LGDHEAAAAVPAMRSGEYRELLADVRAHGIRVPLDILADGRVLDGRHRLKAAREAGLDTVPVRVLALDEAEAIQHIRVTAVQRRNLSAGQRAAVVVALDAVVAKLRGEAKERQVEGGRAGGRRKGGKAVATLPQPSGDTPSDRKAHGRTREQLAEEAAASPRTIQDMLKVQAADADLADKVRDGTVTLPQAVREVRRKEKLRDLEQKAAAAAANGTAGTWEIRQGDCLSELARVEPGTVRLSVCDPPYNEAVSYDGRGAEADRLSDDEYLDWCRKWVNACVPLLATDGSMWVIISNRYAGRLEGLLVAAGLHPRALLTWFESFGVNSANNFNRCSRRLLYFVKDPKRFVFNPEAVTRPSDRQEKYGDERADPGGKLWDDVWGVNPPIPRLVGTSAERVPDFPTQLPLALLRPIVGCASDPGDLVLDPFSGSGTTGAACIELGRKYLGIELSDRYVTLSRQRLAAHPRPDSEHPGEVS
jgi:site-specific DNA-methyltransferase (adenine-specific)